MNDLKVFLGWTVLGWMVLGMGAVTVQAQEPAPTQEGVVNFAWIVGASNCPAGTEYCLREGDRIILVQYPDGDGGTVEALTFVYENYRQSYTFPAQFNIQIDSNSGKVAEVRAPFHDRFACEGNGLDKTMTVKPLAPSKENVDEFSACLSTLKAFSQGNLSMDEMIGACRKDHAVHWRIVSSGNCPNGTMESLAPPEDGQGTGSGSEG